jgi:uncharacterized membrane protein
MERMVVVVFDDQKAAYEGYKALVQLDYEGSVSIHAGAVMKKNADGTVSVEQSGDDFPIRTFGGTAIGALIGLLGGPIGLAIGAAGGALVGSVADLDRAGVNTDFVTDASNKLTPGKWALVADISEEWVTPLDTRMEALGGTVFRSSRESFEDQRDASEIAAMKADLAQLKAEQGRSQAEHKVKLQKKIDNLRAKLQSKLDQAQRKSEARQKEAEAKIQALEKKAAKSKGEAKGAIEARISTIREQTKATTTAEKVVEA